MKKIVLIILSIFLIPAAHADHSLTDVMNQHAAIRHQIETISWRYNVICDTEHSNQSYYYTTEIGNLGSAWKQTALCYDSEQSMHKAHQMTQNGMALGFSELPSVRKVLTVSYTWEDYEPGELIGISIN